MSALIPTCHFPTSVAGPSIHRPQDFQFGATPAPLLDQVFHPSVPSNTAAQQYEHTGDYIHTSLYNLTSHPLSTGYPYSDGLMERMEQNQFSCIGGSNQSIGPPYGPQVVGGG
jgi:hypothetical protein